jgi:hypothetical protein
MAQEKEVAFQSTTLLNNPMSMYTYLFLYKIGTNVDVNIFASIN